MVGRLLAAASLLVVFGCSSDPGSTQDEREARAIFRDEIAPIFEQDCGTNVCHGAEGDRFDTLPATYFAFPVDSAGKITGDASMDKAYERAVEKLSAAGSNFSSLIRKPLDESLGGQSHRGGSQYRSMGEDKLVALMAWAELAKPKDVPTLNPIIERYRDEIQPILARKTCMLSSCHGAGASNLLIFDPGFIGEFDAIATKINYKKVAFHLNLETPDAMLSRLIRKNIPQSQGGIFHRGGNNFFDASGGDEDLQTIVDFIAYTRTELGVDDTGTTTGIVFVATDPTPRNVFDIAAWQPGGDVYSLVPATIGGTQTNLTAAHHTGAADIRDPAVSYDGKKIAFAMRKDQADCLNIYTMNIDGSGLVQVTSDTGTLPNGIKVSSVEPVWGPDDRIYFTSTKSGQVSAQGGYPLSNMWRVDPADGELLRMTYNAGNEIHPNWRFFPATGKAGLETRTLDLTFTATRFIGDTMFAPLMRVPPDFRADYHPHYGTQSPEFQIFTSMTQMPDLREPLILMDESNVWEGGALAIIDRNMGPIISDAGTPSVVNYVDPLRRLEAIGGEVRHRGFSPDGYYRDPQAMPDGTIIVSHSSTAIDLADPAATPDTAIYRVTLLDLENNQVIISSKDLLVDIPGKIETDPRPIYIRRREAIEDPLEHLTNGAETGTILNFDLAVSMTVGAEDSPSRGKPFDVTHDAIRRVRLVEEIQPQPSDFPLWPDVSQNRWGVGKHSMRRIIAEVPATADRSLYVELAAGVPFYVQGVDDMGVATVTFNQWFFILPGEKLKQVTRREVWNNRCGGCHGSVSGKPGETVGKPDVITQASRVVANYDRETRTDLPPIAYGLEPSSRLEVDFSRDVQPILSASCATNGCHDGSRAPDLTDRAGTGRFSGAYDTLTQSGTGSANGYAYVDADGSTARTSYLAEVIMGGELDAPRSYDSNNCPGGSRLSLAELRTLMRWMDLGASYIGIGPKTKPPLPTY